MPYSRNFLSVRIRDDRTTIIVDAISIDDETGEPGSDDPASEIHVALVKLSDPTQRAVSLPVTIPVAAVWEAEFPGAADDWPADERVHVIGIAREDGGPPIVWIDTKVITEGGGDEPSPGPDDDEVAPPPDLA